MVGDVRAAADAGVDPDALSAAQVTLDGVLADLDDPDTVDLAVVFVGAAHAGQIEAVHDLCMERLRPRALLGVTAQGVVAGDIELERPDCLSVWAAQLPGAELTPVRYPPPDPESGLAEWQPFPEGATNLILVADPFSFPAAGFLAWLAQARPEVKVAGGLASGAAAAGGNRLLLDGEMHSDGAVGIGLGGEVRLRHLVSQGCRPVGQSYVVTKAERNIVYELGGEPTAERLREIFSEVDAADKELMQQGLHIGIVIDEYADSYDSGDFLVRAVLGAEPSSGALAVGDVVEVGHTVRFHVRDARSADEDLRLTAERFVAGGKPDAAMLFTCNGRGKRLFGVADHDARTLRSALGAIPIAGFFAAGELGPVAGRNHLHGFTASLLAFSSIGNVDETPA